MLGFKIFNNSKTGFSQDKISFLIFVTKFKVSTNFKEMAYPEVTPHKSSFFKGHTFQKVYNDFLYSLILFVNCVFIP